MAAAGPIKNLVEEATCSICLEFYKDAVATECGHNFCKPCIIRWWGKGATGGLCPQCKTLCHLKNLRANRQLLNVVEIAQQLSLKTPGPPGEGLCEKHEERLKLFCEEDEKLICVICQVSSDHEQHKVRPVKEAAEVFKQELQDILKPLREQMRAAQQSKLKEEEVSRTLRNKLEAERRKLETEFEKLRQTLKEQEKTLLRRIEEMNKKIITVERLKMAKLSAEITCLKKLITEIEMKCGQPAGELLKDIRSTVSRSRQQLTSHVTEEPVQDFPKASSIQHEALHRNNEDIRLSQSKHVIMDPTPGQIKQLYKELLTLDEDTAHRSLSLSEGGRRVTGTDSDQRRPSNPRRFTKEPSVLGREGFTSGRHYWELQLLGEGWWAVGVALESVNREGGGVTPSPEGGVWAVDRSYNGQYRALTSPHTCLSPRQPPLKLGVYLDYEGGRLSIYNADTLEELFTFTSTAFTGRICPYCWLWFGTDLRLV